MSWTDMDKTGFYTCAFCNCRTNAKIRGCCNRGRDYDRSHGIFMKEADIITKESKQ